MHIRSTLFKKSREWPRQDLSGKIVLSVDRKNDHKLEATRIEPNIISKQNNLHSFKKQPASPTTKPAGQYRSKREWI